MLKSILLVIGLVLVSVEGYAQSGWYWQNPLPQGNNLKDIQAATHSIGFVGGNHGTLLKTVTAGTNWERQEFPCLMKISKIHFLNENVGWVTGVEENIVYLYRTGDGGMTWAEQMKSEGEGISVCFIDESIGWVTVDSTIYQTQDGGTTWRLQHRLGPISETGFLDVATGWAVGGPNVYRTTDGGISWESTSLGVYYGFSLSKVRFVNTNVCWVVGTSRGPNHFAGHLFKTIDGGETWDEQLTVGVDFVDYRTFTDIEFCDEELGWAVSPGCVYRTIDGGTTWEEISSTEYLSQITAIDDLRLWGCGDYGVVYTSTDGGSTWERQYEGTITESGDILDLCVVNEHISFAAGGKTLLKTLIGGETWEKTEIDTDDIDDPYFGILSVWFSDSLLGWIGVDVGGGWGGLFRTTDGGYNWTNQIDNVHRIWDIYFVNDTLGWCTSNRLYRTDDGGNSWALQSDQAFECIFFATRDSGWAGGYGGLMKTTDGGYNWTQVLDLRDSAGRITDIHFIHSLKGWAIGYSGVYPGSGVLSYIFKTTDGGLIWESQAHPSLRNAYPQSVYFTDSENGWVVGYHETKSLILHTSTGGALWKQADFPTDHRLFCVEFAHQGFGWIVGERGTIFHTSGGAGVRKCDVNGDGSIDVMDVLELVDHIIGLHILEEDALVRADWNGDSQINVLDVVGIVNVILGIGECEP